MLLSVRHFLRQHYSLIFLLFLVIEMTAIGIIERINGPMSLVWLTNAVSTGVLLRFYPSVDCRHYTVCGAGMLIADLLSGTWFWQVAAMTAVNIVTIVLAYLFLHRYAWRSEKGEWLCTLYSVPQWFLLCQPALWTGSLAGGFVLFSLYGNDYWHSVIGWYLDELLNFAVLLPAVLTIPQFFNITRQALVKKLIHILPCLLLLVVISFIHQSLTFLVVSLLLLPSLLWLVLSGDLFLTTACISLNGICFYIWTIRATYSHLDIVDNIYLHIIRTGVAVLALCGLTIAAAIYERDRLFSQLRKVADNDYLTEVFNRGAFTRQAQALTEDRENSVALLLIDIDYFKKINDLWGHQKGDKVLIAFCRRLKKRLPREVIGRVGGEEFALLLSDISEQECREVADFIVRETASRPLIIDGDPFTVTISAGVAIRNNGENYDTLFNRADRALYEAKNGGRNQWKLYAPFSVTAGLIALSPARENHS